MGNFGESSQSHVNSSLSHSQRLSGVSIDPSLRLTSVSLPSLTAFSSVSARQAPESAEIAQDNPCNLMRVVGAVWQAPESTRDRPRDVVCCAVVTSGQWQEARSPSTQPRAISGILERRPLPRPHHERRCTGTLGQSGHSRLLGHSRALSGALGHSREPAALRRTRRQEETAVRRK